MSNENAALSIKIYRSGSQPYQFVTADFFDINAARREYANIVSKKSAIIVSDDDDAGFYLIPVDNITGIHVREVDPEEEKRKAAEREAADLRRMELQHGSKRHLPHD